MKGSFVMKKIISIFLTALLVVSIVSSLGVNASAVSFDELQLPAFSNRTGFMNTVSEGKTITTGSVTEDSVGEEYTLNYKLTLKDDANVMFFFTATSTNQYASSYPETTLYTDVNLLNEVSLSSNQNNRDIQYGYLAKGTYYLQLKTSVRATTTYYFYAGQVSKSAKFLDVSYVRTNNNKTVTYQLKSLDEINKTNFMTHQAPFSDNFLTARVAGDKVSINDKNQFNESYGSGGNKYLLCAGYDINGFELFVRKKCINKYLNTDINGVKTKTYTGKAIKQSGITLDWGFDDVAYSTTYKNNKNVGKATMILKGKNDTIGELNLSFKIIPGKISKARVQKKGSKYILTWSKSKGATSYQVEKCIKGSWKKVKTVKSCKLKTAKNKKITQFRITGVKKVKGVYYKSSAKKVKVK